MLTSFYTLVGKELRESFLSFSSFLIAAIVLLINGILFQAKVLGKKVVMSEVALNDFFYLSSGIVLVAGVLYASRLLSEETHNKTDYVLVFSKLTVRQIVYSKFFACCMYLIALLIFSVYIPAIIYFKGQVSLLHILVGYSGLFLLGCVSVAVTLMFSALSSKQWIVAILSISLLAVLILLWMLAGILDSPVKEILGFMALHDDHFRGFQKGLVRLSAVTYYVSIVVISLELAIFHWDLKRWKA